MVTIASRFFFEHSDVIIAGKDGWLDSILPEQAVTVSVAAAGIFQ